MAKRGRPKRVVPGKTTSVSTVRGTDSVIDRSESAVAGLDAEIDVVIAVSADVGQNSSELVQPQGQPYKRADGELIIQKVKYEWWPAKCSQCGRWGHKSTDCRMEKASGPKVVKPLGQKVGMSWTRKESGAQMPIFPPRTVCVGGSDGLKKDVSLPEGGNEGWQVVKHKSSGAFRGAGTNQTSMPPVQILPAEVGVGERDSLLVQCGYQMHSLASSSHDSRIKATRAGLEEAWGILRFGFSEAQRSVVSKSEIMEEVSRFYSGLLGTEVDFGEQIDVECFKEGSLISTAQQQMLEAPFTVFDVKEALWDIGLTLLLFT
ncbi:hypothetical protein Dimus_033666 [Dionaea muscipula]